MHGGHKKDAVEVRDPFCGAKGQKALPKWPAMEAHWQRREVMALDLISG
jgi:hypothetical protein